MNLNSKTKVSFFFESLLINRCLYSYDSIFANAGKMTFSAQESNIPLQDRVPYSKKTYLNLQYAEIAKRHSKLVQVLPIPTIIVKSNVFP